MGGGRVIGYDDVTDHHRTTATGAGGDAKHAKTTSELFNPLLLSKTNGVCW